MPTAPSNHVAQLKNLSKALEKAKTLSPGDTLTQEPMFQMLGVSRVTLRNWCNDIDGFEQSGAFVRGAQGIEWSFNPVATIWFLIRHFERVRDQKIERTKDLMGLAGFSDVDDAAAEMSLMDIERALNIRSKLRAGQVEDGTLTDASALANKMNDMILTMQQSAMNQVRRKDPTNGWPVDIRESFEAAFSDLMDDMRNAGKKFVREIRGYQSQSGEDTRGS